MLSSRTIKGKIIENEEDNKAQSCFNIYAKINKKIKRISKLKYKDYFRDIKKLDKNYFIYYYDNKNNKHYYYNDKIINFIKEDDSVKDIVIILYSIILHLKEYDDSSIEYEINIPKKES